MRHQSRSTRALPVLRGPVQPAGGAAPARGPRVGMVTLGCDKNTVDSERIRAWLAGAGARVGEGANGADVIVINTCGFIDIAKEESIDALLDAVRLKAEGRVRAVVAMGCLVQRYKEELARELPEVDLFLGLTEAGRLVEELRSRGLLQADGGVPTMEQPLRLSSNRRHTSFLKVSEGCDHACTFCAIPLMRGKHRSAPIEQLVREAQELEASGVVELGLVSQDTTWYGRDLFRREEETGGGEGGPLPRPGHPGEGTAGEIADGGNGLFVGRPFARMAGVDAGAGARSVRAAAAAGRNGRERRGPRTGRLCELLEALLAETAIPWFRLFYMYPSGIQRDLVELMAREPRIVPYLDMPIQHGSDAVLKRMRRPERRATIRERVQWLRDAVPDLALRTTVIVGFPGETEEDFQALLDLLEEIRFDHVGAFAFSAEEGTPAAEMPDQVPDEVKRERLERLEDVQRGITLERNEAQVGRELVVLVDRAASEGGAGVAVGRSSRDAVEVDGVVLIRGAAGVRAGEFVRVRVTGADEHELTGDFIEKVR
ncbi:MAG TPA: MiaB/RimO family radical SAM methylthiotransferase [Longimicrobiales bacterium]